MIDNYDSFTWNLYQYLSSLGAHVVVYRNDAITLDDMKRMNVTHLVISPGPGHPSTDAGVSKQAIEYYMGKIPVLGVCLGHQCIYELLGGVVGHAGEIVHGKASRLLHDGKGVYASLPQEDVMVTRYHSLAGQLDTLPESLVVTSRTENGVIMGVRHKEYCLEGVQFHPESILSGEHGKQMLATFLAMEGGTWHPEKKGESILLKIRDQRIKDVHVSKQKPGQSLDQLRAMLAFAPPTLDLRTRLLQGKGASVALMAEVKRASPSKGVIDAHANAALQARTYAECGASVISVLTEPTWFHGTLEDMRQARQSVQSMPHRPAILRKDFIVDEYQLVEARVYGADTALLIVAILEDKQLHGLIQTARSLGMEPLVEINNIQELQRALDAGARVIGVNNRDLHTFSVDLNTTSGVAKQLQTSDVVLCALSGITCHADVARYKQEGVHAVLVGEALMRAQDKRAFIHELLLGTQPPVHAQKKRVPLVKICGVRTAEAALAAAEAGADFIGMIFAPSKRQVTIEQAKEIVHAVKAVKQHQPVTSVGGGWHHYHARIGTKPLVVGVFQDQPVQYINHVVQQVGLDVVQLHGHEPQDILPLIHRPAIQAFHMSQTISPAVMADMHREGYHSYTLLDTLVQDSKYQGGQGKTFDWTLARNIQIPFILAGGLTVDNVAEAVRTARPWAVDVSSGVEVDGHKDIQLIQSFVQRAKQT
jgi:anthranilate synthase/indole-3-glycerol phosphate synthase/phosphoribosylanthranilate isomerase